MTKKYTFKKYKEEEKRHEQDADIKVMAKDHPVLIDRVRALAYMAGKADEIDRVRSVYNCMTPEYKELLEGLMFDGETNRTGAVAAMRVERESRELTKQGGIKNDGE